MDARGGAIVQIPKMHQMSNPIDRRQLVQNPLVCLRGCVRRVGAGYCDYLRMLLCHLIAFDLRLAMLRRLHVPCEELGPAACLRLV